MEGWSRAEGLQLTVLSMRADAVRRQQRQAAAARRGGREWRMEDVKEDREKEMQS